ncbi:MAG: preprotein translocase subunit SecY [Candidatus Spechtbacteria bacterium RIFCSPHIGHO2_02_FULL_43_15b]|nr:MAG: preprotein translocase subunit SecY [Candidatus Spechtbacteria bacterium RIFCSPHIGHO2_02_FULL_43_15b]
MVQKLLLLFKIKELKNKILFILVIFGVFRIAANLPVPGVDSGEVERFFGSNQVFGLLNIFSGGALEQVSIVMLGLGPFITATIILQLMTMIFPKLKEIYQEEGEQGRQKFNQYGRMLTVPLAALQGFSFITLLTQQGVIESLGKFDMFVTTLTVTAGAVFLMWLGELISEKGIGNGTSLMIFAGIVASVPLSVQQIIVTFTSDMIPTVIAFFVLAVVIIAGVVTVNEARRNIPVSYAKRVRGGKMFGGANTFLPLNLNPAGVIPIIFALSIMLFPAMVANFLQASSSAIAVKATSILYAFSQNTWLYGIAYFVLVVAFTYFYTAVTFNPQNVANNLQKQGGFVPGIRPGKATAEHLYYILNRTLLIGALFLGGIAVLPSVIQGITGITAFTFLIGGTSVLIVVSVVLETVRQIDSQLIMREYEGFK